MHFQPLNPKCVIEESLVEEFSNILAKKIGGRTLSDQAFMTMREQVILSVETFIKACKKKKQRIFQQC